MGDERFGRPRKAEEADTLLLTRETFETFPDLWSSDPDFTQLDRLSDANPQQPDYTWGTTKLIEWKSVHGETLQGFLALPDDFDPSRKYPMMVYFYERNSDNLHQHVAPEPFRSIINRTFYCSRGYVVFVPDSPYRDGYPGESAMNSVMPGITHLINKGFIDEKKIGVQGHSWGGYQIAYMVTRTNLFAAAEGGAPVSNMTSAYGGIRWGSGLSRMFQYEKTQSRIGGTLWDAQQRYIENSPIFWADKIETPLMMMHNDEDGAVPWYQGIELFVALRRLGKPAWLVNYNGEPHNLTKWENKKDWALRMQQFFDHYLIDAPAPKWLAEGRPAIDKGKDLGLDLIGVEPQGDRHERLSKRKAERDAKFTELSAGVMDMKKASYPSSVDGMEIPVYVFQPLRRQGNATYPALVWIHGGVHGDLDPEHYFPFLREAVEKGYVVVCPEYRGSTGYGKEHYDAIDYGGYEVEDCISAVDYIKAQLPHVDPERLGMIGWSHGGFITLHAMARDHETFKCSVAHVPVTNLVFRLGYKGPRYQEAFKTQERIGGLPHEKREIYIERSPLYQVDKIQTPMIVHVADNDEDVNFVECEQLINALKVKKPDLVQTKVYHDPPGGHKFNRMVNWKDDGDYSRNDSEAQVDSWNLVWEFLDKYLKPKE
jgi:dipeptidyl aminopeptidase/acylaminoacyl peptidase